MTMMQIITNENEDENKPLQERLASTAPARP